MNPLAVIGRWALDFCQAIGAVAVFAVMGLSHIGRRPIFVRNYVRQFIEIGFLSLPVVALTTLFSGMVLVLQSYSGFSRFSAESAVAMVVVLSITRELAPVLAGLMVAGRIGAAMAAERRASGMGFYFSIYFLVVTPAPAIAGWLLDRSGDAYDAIIFAALLFALTAAAAVCFQICRRRLAAAWASPVSSEAN